jgi:hypothetical protein
MNKSVREWWGPITNGLWVMCVISIMFFSGFIVFLVLWLLDEERLAPIPNYSTWQGIDQGLERYFGLNISQKQFLTFNASFEVIGAENVDVSGDFLTEIPGPPQVKVKWITSKDVNLATIILNVDSAAQRTVQLYRLSLQSLTSVFNRIQDVPQIPRLFNTFY